MRINNLFSKNLFRPINGVVKAEQLEDAIVWQELDEYVLTKELDRHFRSFFDAYVTAIDNPQDPNVTDRMGVWVSGFFGSGKSHFIKILSYLLSNRDALNPATQTGKRAINFFTDKIKDPLLLADVKKSVAASTDVVLFNIDSKADASEGQGTILSVFWRVFNEMQGFTGDSPYVAEMERHLSSLGKFEQFCRDYEKDTGNTWRDDRDAYHFHRDEIIQALSRALEQSLESAGQWFDKAETNLPMTIENFAKRVKKFLDSRGKDHRIVFLVDEAGQFIGDDGQLMLNLQTITEDLGRVCQGRAWVIVTSQEDIDAILGDLKSSKANDFSKIQGRFFTRLSLSSSNTDEVIQTRLLEKTPEARIELESLFQEKGDILKSQLSFSHDSATLKTYQDSSAFIQTYPFAPYHFQLVQKVFESIRKAGATGMHLSRGERSMLDAFQSAAKNISRKEVGALVPLYEFYPAIESFLDTTVKMTIEQAEDNAGLERPFDCHLLQTLFLIRYVDIIKPNVDNLVTLFIDRVDTDRLALKRSIETGLQRLEKQTLINRNGDQYFFLTNEERDVGREIKSMAVSDTEELKLMSELIFEEIFKGQNKFKYTPYKRDYGFSRILDSHPYGSKVDHEIGVEIITPLNTEYGLFNSMKCVLYSGEHNGRAVYILPDDAGKTLQTEVQAHIQTEKYIRQKSDASVASSFKKILRDRQEENRDRRIRLTALLERLIQESTVYAMGHQITPKGQTARAGIDDVFAYIVKNLFIKFSYLTRLHSDPNKEIKAVLLATDISSPKLKMDLPTINGQAIREVQEYIHLLTDTNRRILLHELVEHFAAKPYGWPEWEIVLLVARIFMAGEISLLTDASPLEPKEALSPMLKTAQWKTIKIIQRKLPSKDATEKARKVCQEAFGKVGPEDLEELVKAIRAHMRFWDADLSQYRQLALTGDYPGAHEIENALKLIRNLLGIRDTFSFIQTLNSTKDDLLETSEDLHELRDFYTNQRPIWEKLREAMLEFKPNTTALVKDSDASSALNRLQAIMTNPAPYGMLKDVGPLVAKLAAINEAMLAATREKAIVGIESKIKAVADELDKIGISPDIRNRILYPLQQIKIHIGEEFSIPNIAYRLTDFDDALPEAWEAMEKEKHKNDPKPKPAKETKAIKLSSAVTKNFLETEEDVEDFLKHLKKKLLEELKKGVRLQLR